MLSRVADSLYWMSRYLERAEHTARMVDVNVVLMLDQSPGFASQRWGRLLASLSTTLPDRLADDPRAITNALTFDRSQPTSILTSLSSARDNARQVREQISTEMYEQINRLYLDISHAATNDLWNEQPHLFFRNVKEGIHLFQGITDATMSQGEGWQFMEVGRFLERASKTAAFIDAHVPEFLGAWERRVGVNDYLDWVGLLKSLTAFEAYCQVYTADVRPDRIIEFLLLNAEFPRSLRYASGRVQAALRAIGRMTGSRNASTAERLAGRLRSELDYAQVDEIMAGDLHAYVQDIQRQCVQIHGSIYELYISPPLESAALV